MGSKVLVLNAGSSSLKFKVFQQGISDLREVAGGLVERIGDVSNSALKAMSQGTGKKEVFKEAVKDHPMALKSVLQYLRHAGIGDIDHEVAAVGHRVVHGKRISTPVLVTDEVIQAIKEASDLAPLHNPANLQGIRAAQKAFPGKPSVAVFDTAFHQTMPPQAYLYALPFDLYKDKGVQKYGAHGTSVRFLVHQAAGWLAKPVDNVNLIVAHIGAGASMTAIVNGKTLDTSMGLTPLEGLMMGTRSGDVDPSVVLYLQRHCGLSLDQTDDLLNRRSGFLGLAGKDDMRAVTEAAENGCEKAQVSLQVYIHRIRKYLGAYMLHLHGNLDAIVFSAGIGENSPRTRREALANLQAFGIETDDGKNEGMVGGKSGEIQTAASKVKVLVIPTNEELSIAEQTLQVVQYMRT